MTSSSSYRSRNKNQNQNNTNYHHMSLSPSPIHLAFSGITWNSSPIIVSSPEASMLTSAEDNPLEYTLAEYDDAFCYTRLLLKVLDQVTGPSNPGVVSQLPLEQIPFDVEEAYEYYTQDKAGVVTHYIITKLYDVIGLLQESRDSQIQITTLFYNQQTTKLLDDWRPLLRLLYRGGTGDAYSQRGAAMCLALILKAGCMDFPKPTNNNKSSSISNNNNGNKNNKRPSSSSSSSCDAEETLQSLVSWLTSRLQSSHYSVSLGVVTPTLVVLATCPPARLIFDQSGGIGYLTRHLRQFQNASRKNAYLTSRGSTTATSSNMRRQSSMTGMATSSNNKKNDIEAPPSPITATSYITSHINVPATPTRRRSAIKQFQRQSSSSTTTTTSMYSSPASPTSSSSANNVQQLYEMCFCLWAMTYDCYTHESIKQHFRRDGAIPALATLLISSRTREKVTRLALSSLRNLAQLSSSTTTKTMGNSITTTTTTTAKSSSSFVQEMIGCGVHKSVKSLLDRQWTDPDIVEDLEVLNRILQENFKELSRWEVYLTELDTGRFEWGILHTTQFFQENSRKFEGPNMDFEPLKRLINILKIASRNAHFIVDGDENDDDKNDEDDDDSQLDTMAIACFDIGEFVRYYPNGKVIANRLGAKQLVMPLMDHHNQDVQRHALTCVSKMLVQNWMSIADLGS